MHIPDKNESSFANTGVTLEKFKPTPGWVLVQREDANAGRLIQVPKNEEDRRRESGAARVIKVGAAYPHPKTGAKIKMEVVPGDRVAIKRYAGHDILLGGVPYVQMTEEDILVVIPDDITVSDRTRKRRAKVEGRSMESKV